MTDQEAIERYVKAHGWTWDGWTIGYCYVGRMTETFPVYRGVRLGIKGIGFSLSECFPLADPTLEGVLREMLGDRFVCLEKKFNRYAVRYVYGENTATSRALTSTPWHDTAIQALLYALLYALELYVSEDTIIGDPP